MKIIDVTADDISTQAPCISTQTPCGWRVLPDSAWLKTANPFFVPDFPGGVRSFAALALRISRLGKGIPARFASGYYDSWAPAVIFRAEEYGKALRSQNLPDSAAYCFDKALVTGSFQNNPLPGQAVLRMAISPSGWIVGNPENNTAQTEVEVENLPYLAAKSIETLSRDNTLKTGDLIILSSSETGLNAVPATRLTLSIISPNPSILQNPTSDLKLNIK